VSGDDQPSELDPLLESAKVLDRVSDVARARIRARARATVAGAHASTLPAAARRSTSPTSPTSRSRLALAAGVAFVLGATGTAAAFLGPFRGHRSAARHPAATAPESRAAAPIVKTVADNERVLPSIDTEPVVETAPPRHHRRASRVADAGAAELALIQKAQAAYADGNLPTALELLEEHGRRFPNGRLAEEREALRVRSLAGCGRAGDARRALQAFADRYPQSVLLPHLRETLGSGTHP
jgi:hypothetical protein